MVERDKICEGKVKHAGLFSFGETYNFLYTWLSGMQYKVEEKGYSEKIKPEGKEVEVHWEAKRKISDYFRFFIKIDWLILRMTEVEVKKGAAKVKLNKADVEIKVGGYLEKDYEHRWEATAILKFLRGLYDRFIIKSRIESYEDKIKEEVDEFSSQIKAFLALHVRR